MPTNEELIVARQTKEILEKLGDPKTGSGEKGRQGEAEHTSPKRERGRTKETSRSWVTSMFLAKVTGSVVATQKVASMVGRKLLTVEPLRVDPAQRDQLVSTGRTFVVVDTVGAGLGEMVLIVQGSSARMTPETEKLPVDATIIGIVDSVNVENQTLFSAHESVNR